MARFQFGVLVGDGDRIATALGASGASAARFTDKDINKAVKLAANNNYVLCADGDEIEAVVDSIQTGTVNEGFSHGSVLKGSRVEAINAGVAAIAVGALVVAAAQEALGTEQTGVKVKAGAPANFKWRVLSLLSGTGQIGETILLERV